ncbi:uncharacterized protein [Linepithema humile]|uniref:uncharacterized protein n=1 Tax=Linepithema humile TaxID=83485 RepID=UPI0006232853|nr:PREDICTED: uncharacterized protein LOC105671277 [Linepithema humile]
MSKSMVQVTIHSRYNDFSKTLTCLIIPSITDRIPADVFPRERVRIPPNIKLANPYFHVPNSINLIIGSGATLSLFSIRQINLSRDGYDLFLQKTRLGWVIVGSASAQTQCNTATCQLTSLEKQLIKFWEIEEVATDKSRSEEKIERERHFVNNVFRNKKGRYKVRLPFRKIAGTLGESRAMALRRLSSLERKFDADKTLKNEYTRVIEEHLRLGHMTVVRDCENNGYYMPHHAVIKETSNTTKVRVVFDASAKTSNGISLNEALMVGPTIQNKLFTHLMRFRTYNYVITADVEKMYCQVLLHEDDRRFQRILWRVGERVETLQFNTLTFSVASSPFLAIRVIQKLADDENHMYPRAEKIIKAHLYVDDLLTGAEIVEET